MFLKFSQLDKSNCYVLQELYSKKKEFLVLDVATSNVDMVTDQYIQNCLKTKFKDTTIITIAHRLDTIADYDRVIVMDKGTIV